MDAKEAAKAAKDYVLDVFGDDDIYHVALEEIKYEGTRWKVTVGFYPGWARTALPLIPNPKQRRYKVVNIRDSNGEVLSVTHRNPPGD